jgi:hypothetical protein
LRKDSKSLSETKTVTTSFCNENSFSILYGMHEESEECEELKTKEACADNTMNILVFDDLLINDDGKQTCTKRESLKGKLRFTSDR